MTKELITNKETFIGMAASASNIGIGTGNSPITAEMLSNYAFMGMTVGAWALLLGIVGGLAVLSLNIMKNISAFITLREKFTKLLKKDK